jgi:hypothetical protein
MTLTMFEALRLIRDGEDLLDGFYVPHGNTLNGLERHGWIEMGQRSDGRMGIVMTELGRQELVKAEEYWSSWPYGRGRDG